MPTQAQGMKRFVAENTCTDGLVSYHTSEISRSVRRTAYSSNVRVVLTRIFTTDYTIMYTFKNVVIMPSSCVANSAKYHQAIVTKCCTI